MTPRDFLAKLLEQNPGADEDEMLALFLEAMEKPSNKKKYRRLIIEESARDFFDDVQRERYGRAALNPFFPVRH